MNPFQSQSQSPSPPADAVLSGSGGPGSALAPVLAGSAYLRERLEPQPGDHLYLHLSDLRLAMDRVATSDAVRLLDFGCGGSPYRSLFPRAEYVRADLEGTPGIDLVIGADGRSSGVTVSDGSFDRVLSSQVLEHVPDPSGYLRECRRLLRLGGTLVLSTHGMFEEHGCPDDYRRWTAAGLRYDLERSGLAVQEMYKLTTGSRAALFLYRHRLARVSRRTVVGMGFWLFNEMLGRRGAAVDRVLDRSFPGHRVVPAAEPGHDIYVGLFAVATRT